MYKAEIVGTVTVSSAGVVKRIKNGLKNNRDSSRGVSVEEFKATES